ncbi:carboxypeptidase-like regulatory domain-containing protein [Zobellia roscoffensis]|uniref:carboxypeptidase-like regulatory domain-containing protein n=1 Tax=Zobellia roscoffensis TaxID=2779508 RepID=UPI00188C7E24|nr:carboxypeptidase-like regulatory domain-containing protein [Zobellia roscoffensis]
MKRYLSVIFFFITYCTTAQEFKIVDGKDRSPISFATISFGDGLGTFADEEGSFTFSSKKYPDIDTLFISGLGYKEKALLIPLEDNPTATIVKLDPEVSQLGEVIVSAPKEGKFKFRKQKAQTHNDIFACWLPTVESEIAVLFTRYENKASQISKLYLPVNAESEYKFKGKGKFATIFRAQFYENNKGTPGSAIPYESVIFAMDEKADKVFELDLLSKSIFIPESGIFISIQVLGYAGLDGKLIETKKYREIKTSRGIQKISTSFRPLLPFIKGEANQRTFVRRIFFNDKKWQVFDQNYNPNSKLLQTGHRNYGMGAEFKVFESN